MRYSNTLIPTLKEVPKEAKATSHSLMLRAGLIRRFTSGIYSYLPLGWKVLHNIINIIREEMDKAGAVEILLPALHPLEIWQKSGRDKALSEVLYTFDSPHGRKFVLGPTHEEVVTDLVASEVSSYKELPIILYQIQTKFRDEPRPRSGVLRSLEFIMKDAYSFDKDIEGSEVSYKKMHQTYCNIFQRCGLPYVVVEADPGAMGGDVSHEFMVVSDSGEDKIVICESCGYAASLEVAQCSTENRKQSTENRKKIKEVDTPGITTVEKVSKLLKVTPDKLLKTLIYEVDEKDIAVLIRGDCEVNEVKLKNILNCQNLRMANDKKILEKTGAPLGFSGPVGLDNIEKIADNSVYGMKNFVTGANKKDKHLINVNIRRDFKIDRFQDIRYIKPDDVCPKCKSNIKIKNSIEVGHIFKLGTKYSNDFKANFLDDKGQQRPIIMGCYGIGINRIIAASIESNNDEDGIIWPFNIAPFKIIILPLRVNDKSIRVFSEKIYNSLLEEKIEVLLDDRDEQAGVKFNDADLLGIPYRVIIGKKFVKMRKIELQTRKDKKSELIPVENCIEKIVEWIKKS